MRWEALVCLLALLATGGLVPAQSGNTYPSTSARRSAGARLADPQDVRKRLGLLPDYQDVPGLGRVKVAVLDYGFDGLNGPHAYLPRDTVVVEHYDPAFVRRFGLGDVAYRKGFEPLNRHGREMAQIVWAVTGARPDGPRFFLLNANGPTLLRRAVRYAIEQRVDVILFSGTFEGGGNGDGRGPVDRVVDDAVAAGILWVNAAGNYGHRVYNGPVRVLPDGYLRLRAGSDVAALRFRNRFDENTVTVTLTWNDYRGEEDAGTDKDLDLLIEDWAGRRVGGGQRVQVSGARAAGPEQSRNPRERVVLTDLPANPDLPADPDYCYRIRVRAKAGRFDARDRLRILLTASRDVYSDGRGDAPAEEAVEFVDATGDGELFPPADHPGVFTVGDLSATSSVGPTADGRVKPDVVLEDSRAYFSDGQVSAGTSNAAAYLAGVVAVLKAAEPRLQTRHLLTFARQGVAASREDRSPRPPATRPANPRAPLRSATPPPPTRLDLRVWKTPSRARLAETLGADR